MIHDIGGCCQSGLTGAVLARILPSLRPSACASSSSSRFCRRHGKAASLRTISHALSFPPASPFLDPICLAVAKPKAATLVRQARHLVLEAASSLKTPGTTTPWSASLPRGACHKPPL